MKPKKLGQLSVLTCAQSAPKGKVPSVPCSGALFILLQSTTLACCLLQILNARTVFTWKRFQ